MINIFFFGVLLLVFIIVFQSVIGIFSAIFFGKSIGFGESFELGIEISKGALFGAIILCFIAVFLINGDVFEFPDSWIPKDRFGGTDVVTSGFMLYFGFFALIYIPCYIYCVMEKLKFHS
ncbi:hypothetical protein ACS79_15010 [Vibrio lentus]|nr:hypothetical protein ACS79_15010 [Vibrio lentus]